MFLSCPFVATLQDWSVSDVRKLKCQPCLEVQQLIEHYIQQFQAIADDTSLTKTIRRDALRDIKSLKQMMEPKRPEGLVNCICGEYYNPRWTLFHGKNHVIIGRKVIVGRNLIIGGRKRAKSWT